MMATASVQPECPLQYSPVVRVGSANVHAERPVRNRRRQEKIIIIIIIIMGHRQNDAPISAASKPNILVFSSVSRNLTPCPKGKGGKLF